MMAHLVVAPLCVQENIKNVKEFFFNKKQNIEILFKGKLFDVSCFSRFKIRNSIYNCQSNFLLWDTKIYIFYCHNNYYLINPIKIVKIIQHPLSIKINLFCSKNLIKWFSKKLVSEQPTKKWVLVNKSVLLLTLIISKLFENRKAIKKRTKVRIKTRN